MLPNLLVHLIVKKYYQCIEHDQARAIRSTGIRDHPRVISILSWRRSSRNIISIFLLVPKEFDDFVGCHFDSGREEIFVAMSPTTISKLNPMY
jgi:hypothetical protein